MWRKLAFVGMLVLLVVVLSAFVGAVQSQAAELPPLTEPGPYGVRVTKMTFVDESRDDWELETRIWYPADKTQGTPVVAGGLVLRDAPPDRSGAPYPLIIYSHWWTGASLDLGETKALLASHGYIVAAPQHHDTDPIGGEFVDRPLDILLALNGLAAVTEGDLAGMIDTSNVGLMGYSQGGDTVFQMLGLLSSLAHYETWCAEHPDLAADDCTRMPVEETMAYRARLGLQNAPDGQWMPFGDERIHAVVAMDACDFPLTTDDMLASVTTPTMILHGNKDETCDYEGNAVRTYTHLGTDDRYLISLVNGFHGSIASSEQVPQHFAVAFFGEYLQGDETYALYLTAEGLPTFRRLEFVWGPYEGE